jgi:RNA recognition motif-containing protein
MSIMLHVDNLSARVTDDDLIETFADYGVVESATMDHSRASTSDKQSACVIMSNSEEAQAAIDWLHDTQFKGSTISVARAQNNKEVMFWLHLDLPR